MILHNCGTGPAVDREIPAFARLARLCLFSFALLASLAVPAAEAASYKVGSFIKTSGASQTVPHGLGVAPKAIMFWTEGKTDENFGIGSLFAFGSTDGTTSASTATGSQDAAAPTYASNRFASKALTIVQGGGATLAEADLAAWDATGFTLNWTANNAIGYVIHFIAIGGSDVSAKVVLWNAPTVAGNLAVNTVGFQPDVVIHSLTSQVASPSTGAEGEFVLGVSAGTAANQWSNSIYSSGASPSVTQRAQSNAASLYMVRNAAILRQASFVSMNPTGFTLNHTAVDAANAHQVFSLALKGMQVRVGAFNKALAAGVQTQAVGIRSRLVLLSSVQNVSAAGSVTHARYGVGASDGTNEGSSAFQDQNGQTPSNVDGIDKTSKAFVKVNNSIPAISDEADMLGFSEDSFVLDWQNTDAVATQILYLALGDVTTYYRSIGTNAVGYTQGSVSVTRGSTLVTGTGGTPPDWVTANRGRGDRITITGQGTFTILQVSGPTSLQLTGPFTGASGTYTYSIVRNFNGAQAWYDCVDGTTACTPAGGANLVTSRRKEVGVAYKDGPLVLGGTATWDSATTSAAYDITLTADGGNRHLGVFGGGVIFDNNSNSIRPYNAYMTFEWLEFRNGSPRVFHISNIASPNKLTVRFCLFHSTATEPLNWFSGQHDADVYDNIFWGTSDAIQVDLNSTVNVYNNTFYNLAGQAVIATAGSTVTLRNNVALGCSGNCYGVATLAGTSSNNITSDTAALTTHSPGGGGLRGISATANASTCADVDGCVGFLSLGATPNLHLISTTYTNQAVDSGVNLAGTISTADIDVQGRINTWDRGADELNGTTAVSLTGFAATAGDGRVNLTWTTASELQNLGFHLYGSESEGGPYTRITSSLIPGLGSSATGKSYSYVDAGLVDGQTYFYELEDVETTGKVELHGPVSATPKAAAASEAGTPASSPGVAYGDPQGVVLREVERSAKHVVLELLTPGFYASPAEDGRFSLSIPRFETLSRPGELALPGRRVLVEAVAGRKVQLATVVGSDVVGFPGLRPAVEGVPELEVSEDGSVRPSRRPVHAGGAPAGVFPAESALLSGTAFQGETKKAEVLLFPLRFDGRTGELELSRRLLVRLEFAGTEAGERPLGGTRGRKAPQRRSRRPSGVVAQLLVKERGLYRVGYEEVFPATGPGARVMSAASLKLLRQGESVAFHVTPDPRSFGPGSSLFFLSEGEKLNPYGDAVYELETDQPGLTMPVEAPTSSSAVVTEHFQTLVREENKYYQSGLLDAPDLWQWDIVVSPGTKSYSFAVDHLSPSSSSARLVVELQGASDFEGVVDHHVRVGVNGSPAGEASWDGKLPKTLELEVGAGILREGENTLELENVGDTGAAYSMFFLDRFSLSYPRTLVASGGRLEGRFAFSGQAEVQGLAASSILLDTTETPRWLLGASATPTGLAFPVQAGRSYLATSTVLHPTVHLLGTSTLKSSKNRADYLLVAPREFLPAAQPLLDLRASQGLETMAVSVEEIYEQFGHGEVTRWRSRSSWSTPITPGLHRPRATFSCWGTPATTPRTT